MIDVLLAAAAHLLAAESLYDEEDRARIERAPQPVAAFIARRANCNHFLGEEPYDRQRRAELDRVIRELRCERIEIDERRMRSTYRHDVAILQLLDDTADAPGG
jgi:hypothetical protein